MGDIVIGIDLGTTYSAVAYWDNDNSRVNMITNDQGNRTTPSYVAFTENEKIVGQEAKNQIARNVSGTVYDIKRFIGRSYDDPVLAEDKERLGYNLISKEGVPYVSVDYHGKKQEFSAEEISAMILGYMKSLAERHLGRKVSRAVITVPAYFNDAQRMATKNAGQIAGMEVLRIINEPTAAAVAYGLDTGTDEQSKNVLVFDLGGGTFDVTLLKIEDGLFMVRSTSGDTHLGGEDFDQRMVTYFAEDIMKKHEIDILKKPRVLAKLKKACEQAKRTLSSSTSAELELDIGEIEYVSKITRSKFESLNSDLFARCMLPVTNVLDDVSLEPESIDEVVLIGGSTRIPKIRSMLSDYFTKAGNPTRELCTSINPDEAVAYGAAIQGAILAGTENETIDHYLLIDAVPLSLGIECTGEVMNNIIRKGTSIPVTRSKMFSTHKDNQTSVTVSVYEGERARTRDNHLLGEFDLTDIPRMPRCQPKIEVTFAVDANGILEVTAEEISTGNKNELVITSENSNRLSPEEIKRMIDESDANEQSDNAYKIKIETKNKLENYAYGFKSALAGASGINVEEKQELDGHLDEVIQWIENMNLEEVTREDMKEKLTLLEELSEPYLDIDESGKEIKEVSVTVEDIDDGNDIYDELNEDDYIGEGITKDELKEERDAEEKRLQKEKEAAAKAVAAKNAKAAKIAAAKKKRTVKK